MRGRGWREAELLVKWTGSKAGVVKKLAALAPRSYERFHEPFLGGGSLFFELKPKRAVLADLNAELINAYRVARDEPESLIAALATHQNTRTHYLSLRGIPPDDLPPVERAARTLFLNRTCFNGLYRVNRHGLFNVPYGNQAHTSFFHPATIRRVHQMLQGASILCEDFEQCLERVGPGDFVYLDPPYAAGMGTTKIRYQRTVFGEADQRRVAALMRSLDRRGCRVMASNADCPLIRELYGGFDVQVLSVTRRVGGWTARRGQVTELVIRNYSDAATDMGGRDSSCQGLDFVYVRTDA